MRICAVEADNVAKPLIYMDKVCFFTTVAVT